jgi:hypothetical protein
VHSSFLAQGNGRRRPGDSTRVSRPLQQIGELIRHLVPAADLGRAHPRVAGLRQRSRDRRRELFLIAGSDQFVDVGNRELWNRSNRGRDERSSTGM